MFFGDDLERKTAPHTGSKKTAAKAGLAAPPNRLQQAQQQMNDKFKAQHLSPYGIIPLGKDSVWRKVLCLELVHSHLYCLVDSPAIQSFMPMIVLHVH